MELLDKAIASEDYKNYIKENELSLTEWDMATLIWNNQQLYLNEKMQVLLELREQTSDIELKRQIEERYLRDRHSFKEFREDRPNAYYELWTRYKKCYKKDGDYLNYEYAYGEGMKEGGSFRITKKCFECQNKSGNGEGVFGTVEFNPDGSVGSYYHLYTISRKDDSYDENKERFESRVINLPLCFKKGDIVKIVGKESYGIVEALDNDEDEANMKQITAGGDYSDFQVPVNIIFNGEKYATVFAHTHISPAQLEYANLGDEDTRKGFLEYVVKAVYSNSQLEGTGRGEGRIPEVLARIEKIWKQYPDMRFGQLMLEVCGNKDLFFMEDKDFVACLENNIFDKEEI